MKIGVLIPEFPGQTHAFFWRELAALRALGVEPEIVSTRRPPPGIVSHPWSLEASARTVYLAPPSASDLGGAALEIARGLPRSAVRVADSVARARGLDLKGRARLVGLAVMGARLAHIARERHWRHVHAHSCADAAHVAMFARRLGGSPYSVTLHGPLSDYGPNQRQKWRHAAFGIVITRKLYDEVNTQLAGDLPPVVDVAPMGADTGAFVRSRPYVPWDRAGPLRLFSCGRLNPCKGHGDLVKAVGILRARGIDARLEIAGEDEQGGSGFHATLAEGIAAAKLGDAVTLLGAVSEQRVRTGLEAAHIFALASLAEPLGVAIMEAMSLGTPVVVTGAGGVPELVRDGVDGLLVPPEDIGAMAGAIERAAGDPAFAAGIANPARRGGVADFHITRRARVLASRVTGGT